jgi:hypothetical protein
MNFNSLFFDFTLFSFQLYIETEQKILIIKDKDTDLAIEDVTVSIAETKQNLVSNSEGVTNF